MNVKLVSISNPCTTGINNAEDLVVYCARVSNPTNQLNTETSPRLLKYLIKHKHWSPFEMVHMCVEITTSRAIAAQILRHRSFSFQEFSQRYAAVTDFEKIEWRAQGKTNRQVGNNTVVLPTVIAEKVENLLEQSEQTYNLLIGAGIAKESARMILPLTTKTTLYMSGSVRSWIHYIDIRTKEDTQKEHRQIAEEIKKLFIKNFPVVSEALEYIDADISSIPKL